MQLHTMTHATSKYFANMLIMVATLFSLVACTENKLQFKSIDITGADYARDFAADGAGVGPGPGGGLVEGSDLTHEHSQVDPAGFVGLRGEGITTG